LPFCTCTGLRMSGLFTVKLGGFGGAGISFVPGLYRKTGELTRRPLIRTDASEMA